jgi:putative oxidoreductase
MKRCLPASVARGIYGLCRIALGVIFIYAASWKISAPQELADSIASYHLVPYPIISLLALGLPLFELTGGLLLLTGYFCATGLLSIISLLFLFLAALLYAVLRGTPIDCGCFGMHSWLDANPWWALARDGLLLMGALYAYRYRVELEMVARKQGGENASSVLR